MLVGDLQLSTKVFQFTGVEIEAFSGQCKCSAVGATLIACLPMLEFQRAFPVEPCEPTAIPQSLLLNDHVSPSSPQDKGDPSLLFVAASPNSPTQAAQRLLERLRKAHAQNPFIAETKAAIRIVCYFPFLSVFFLRVQLK